MVKLIPVCYLKGLLCYSAEDYRGGNDIWINCNIELKVLLLNSREKKGRTQLYIYMHSC